MKQINIGAFQRLSRANLEELGAFEILCDGQTVGYFATKKDFIYVGDMHIRVRNSFRAIEKKVRMGMPAAEKVEIKTTEEV